MERERAKVGGEHGAYIARALATEGGHLAVGRGGFTLHYDRGCRLSGYDCDEAMAEAIAAGLPVIDSREVPFEVAARLAISGPMVAVGEPESPQPWHALSFVPLRVVAEAYRAAGAEVFNLDGVESGRPCRERATRPRPEEPSPTRGGGDIVTNRATGRPTSHGSEPAGAGTPGDRSYRGWRDGEGACHVAVVEADGRERPLDPRFDLANKSPTGFEWSYAGSGPAQLSLALCADALGDDEAALAVFQRFKFAVVARLDRERPWCLTAAEARASCAALSRDRG